MSDNKKPTKKRKRATIRPIIITPIIFVLIASVVAVPVFLKVYAVLEDSVHEAQGVLSMSYADVTISDDYFTECEKERVPQTKDALSVGDKVGRLECNNAAVGCDIYYGINRVSERSGAGLSVKSNLFGDGGSIHLDGDAAGAFKALYNVKKGDVFTVTTCAGEYQYTVTEILTTEEYDGKDDGERLVLTTDKSSDAFAHLDKARYTVIAELGAEEGE